MKAKYYKMWLEYLMLSGELDEPITEKEVPAPAEPKPLIPSAGVSGVSSATPVEYIKAYHDALVSIQARWEEKQRREARNKTDQASKQASGIPRPILSEIIRQGMGLTREGLVALAAEAGLDLGWDAHLPGEQSSGNGK